MAPGRESSPNQGRLQLDPTGSSLLCSSSWPLFRAFLISLFGTKTNGLTNTCRISREEVLHRHQVTRDMTRPWDHRCCQESSPNLSSPAWPGARLPGWALLFGADLHPPPVATSFRRFSKQEQLSPSSHSPGYSIFASMQWDIAGLLQPEQRGLDCPPLGRAPRPACSRHHTPKSTRKKKKRGSTSQPYHSA